MHLRLDFRTSWRDKDSAPRIIRVCILPPANIRQSFVSRVLKNRDFSDFSCYGKIREDFQGASSGFGRVDQNPAGALLL